MRIVVGFKVTPDYEALRAGRLGAGGAGGGAAEAALRRPATSARRSTSSTRPRWSSRCALRDARAAAGLETSLAAFSVAGREADPFLRTLQALGYECARVEAGADLDFAPSATAALVAACAKRLGGDVLLLARAAAPVTAAWCRSWSPRRSAGRA